MFPTSESLMTLKVLTDIALMSGIILVGLKVLMSPSRNPKQIMELDAALKSLIREADHAGRDLNDQLLGRQQVLERLLVDLQSTEGRLNTSLVKVEEGRKLLEQAVQRADGISNLLTQRLDEMVIPQQSHLDGFSGANRSSANSTGTDRKAPLVNRIEGIDHSNTYRRYEAAMDAQTSSTREPASRLEVGENGRTDLRPSLESSLNSNAFYESRRIARQEISDDQRIETLDEAAESAIANLATEQRMLATDSLRHTTSEQQTLPNQANLRVRTPLMAEIERETVTGYAPADISQRNTVNSQPLASLVERELQQTRSAVQDLFSKFEQIESRVSSVNRSWEAPSTVTPQNSQNQARDSLNNNILLNSPVDSNQGEAQQNQQSRSTNINRNDQRLGALGPIKREVTVL